MERILAKQIRKSYPQLAASWIGEQRCVVWSILVIAMLLLGALRTATDAELTFVLFSLFPVVVSAWVGGRWRGLFVALFGAAIWSAGDFASALGDIASDRQFSSPLIPWVNALSLFVTYALVALFVARVRMQLDSEHEQATRDALTGLHNRWAFLEEGAFEVERSKRYAHPLSVVFLDLDDFKQLNDTRGHDAGDAALKATANALRSTLRYSDRVARFGGDEFVILLPEIGYDEAFEAGRKISHAVDLALQDFSPVRASIGVAWFGEVDRGFPEMLKAADDLMYKVKGSGKNSVHVHSFTPARTSAPDA